MFDAKKYLIDKFGTVDGIIRDLSAFGVDPPERSAAEKWFARGAIPGRWFPVVFAVARAKTNAADDLPKYISKKEVSSVCFDIFE